jgi:hypothetical protein
MKWRYVTSREIPDTQPLLVVVLERIKNRNPTFSREIVRYVHNKVL